MTPRVLGKIALRLLGAGDGWTAREVVCRHGPTDQPYEERHGAVSVAMVMAGTFQYRCGNDDHLLVPGSLMLGNYGDCFECRHEHGIGDRCIAFHFKPEYFERIVADAGHTRADFPLLRIPPVRELARTSAMISTGLFRNDNPVAWEEAALNIAAHALSLANHQQPRNPRTSRLMVSRVTESIRHIEARPELPHTLQQLADAAGVSAYYYLRLFERVAGVTPHQFILRTRLRHAAHRIAHDNAQIAHIAFRSGFGDLSNFNHAFKLEFGVSPRAWRARAID